VTGSRKAKKRPAAAGPETVYERSSRLLERVKKKRAYVHERYNPGRTRGCGADDVREVLVIDSASRSGSSFLYYLLSHHRNVVSLNGEGSLFDRLHGIALPRTAADSDFIPSGGVLDKTLARTAEDILKDAGTLSRIGDAEGWPGDSYAADCVQRLLLQYPEADLEPDVLHDVCAKSLADHSANGARFSSVSFWRELLEALSRARVPVSSRHYDLHGGAGGESEVGPPPFSVCSLEDPPFIVPEPRVFPSRQQWASKTLLLKSPSYCYRMWTVRRMFPRARFRFVVLVRNPAAAISSLMDGWLSGGFYSHNLEDLADLTIDGYSRSDRPWTKKWWKFDLPPGWAEAAGRPLDEVCALQWRIANEHILRDIQEEVIEEKLVVRYESLLNPTSLAKELQRIAEFAGLENAHFRGDDVSRPIMAVTPPAPGKWRKRKDEIRGVLADSNVSAVARAWGYETGDWEEWL
jgi:hypothetical protein